MQVDRAKSVESLSTAFGAIAITFVATLIVFGAASALAGDGPDPIFEKPAPITLKELAGQTTAGVSVLEVKDYAPGHYTGKLAPSPPHADLNPKKAFIVFFKDHDYRLVFNHEASYCPILELPSGAGMCNQFFEGNIQGTPENHQGSAELFNIKGRKERNSFVDVIQSGPDRAWVRWNYLAVDKKDDTQPRLRGTEDYFAYPNGLILRRMTYESLIPDSYIGYSQQPVELFGIAPVGKTIGDLFTRDPKQGDYLTLVLLDLYTDQRYDVYWSADGQVRRRGDESTLEQISGSAGYALVMPFRERLLFAALGDASGFRSEKTDFVDHCTPGAKGGCEWGQGRWDHWPIGWLNSQASDWKPGSPYSYSFGSIGQFFVPDGKRYTSFVKDYFGYGKDMELNRWTSNGVFYVLLGSARDWDEIRRLGKSWLDKGGNCAKPESISDLR